ncbi:MAG: hypothetical protein ACYS76_04475 [Planctomycetota bacterium]|jgi:hypothetical protein
MTSFDWDRAKQWGLDTFGFLCFIFLAGLGAIAFVTWSWPVINNTKLGMALRAFLVASAFMGFIGGIEE